MAPLNVSKETWYLLEDRMPDGVLAIGFRDYCNLQGSVMLSSASVNPCSRFKTRYNLRMA